MPEEGDGSTPVVEQSSADAGDDDWPAKATVSIVDFVDSVREATTGRALTVSAGIVYGIAILGAVLTSGILVTIVVFRGLERLFAVIANAGWFFGDFSDPQPMWAVYVFCGLCCLGTGLALWRRRPDIAPSAPGR